MCVGCASSRPKDASATSYIPRQKVCAGFPSRCVRPVLLAGSSDPSAARRPPQHDSDTAGDCHAHLYALLLIVAEGAARGGTAQAQWSLDDWVCQIGRQRERQACSVLAHAHAGLFPQRTDEAFQTLDWLYRLPSAHSCLVKSTLPPPVPTASPPAATAATG